MAGPNISTGRLNVLVYSGNGTTPGSIRQCLFSLRRLLDSNYAVIPVTGEMILKEPWTAGCALLVIPGGADVPYTRTLNGEGNRRIRRFVERGGAYLGLCAGGYYGSSRCEFEVGNKKMEVVGDRELAFFPGTCRGCAFPGFVYDSNEGARAAELKVSKTALSDGTVPEVFRCYYNGGGVFVDAPKYKDKGIEVLASFTEPLNVDPGEGSAAAVYCPVGEGAAVLTSPHPEFTSANVADDMGKEVTGIVGALSENDTARTDFLKACLAKLGLRVNQESSTVPPLSPIHVSALEPDDAASLFSSLQDLTTVEDDGEEYLKDDNDKFRLRLPSALDMGSLAGALPDSGKETNQEAAADGRIVDYNAIVKDMVLHEGVPESKLTPYFDHDLFYTNLKQYRSQSKEDLHGFGAHLLYGQVVTSTNTLLEKNTQLLRKLPTGFTATAMIQVAGRGRGSNVWISPAGLLMFSVCIRYPMEKMNVAPIVFLQYLVAMAIVHGIKTYGEGYDQIPVKMKWPNDIYALEADGVTWSKICGILVNAHFSSNEYIAVVGAGVNTLNSSPTTSLKTLLSTLPASIQQKNPLSLEKLLARILTTFDSFYTRFLRTGFDKDFEDMYYADWLHMDQIVTLEAEGGVRARIKGITRDYGLLLAQELGWEDRPTGKVWQLQSDSNSFDFFKGLVKRKV